MKPVALLLTLVGMGTTLVRTQNTTLPTSNTTAIMGINSTLASTTIQQTTMQPSSSAPSTLAPSTRHPLHECPQAGLPTGCNCTVGPVHIVRVDCTNNNWKDLPDNLPYNVQELYITGSELDVISSVPYTLLKTLNLDGNKVLHIRDGAFKNLTQLKMLSVTKNLLTHVRADMFEGLKNLDTLDLSFNKISVLYNDSFNSKHLENIRHIILNANSITEVTPDAFVKLARLETLLLARNQLPSVPPMKATSMPHLISFDLQLNVITEVKASAFIAVKNMTSLSLKNNKISLLSGDSFVGLKKLKALHLGYNEIAVFPLRLLRDCTALSSLEVNNNRINTLPLRSLPRYLFSIRLHDNPWHCDCEMVWVPHSRLVDITKDGNISCVSPPNLQGRDMTQLKAEDFMCPRHLHARVGMALGIVATILAFTALLILLGRYLFKRRRDIGLQRRGGGTSVYKRVNESMDRDRVFLTSNDTGHI